MSRRAAAAALLVGGVGALVAAAVVLQRRRRAARRERLEALCRRLPKAELHAHLHGCARLSTIAELAPAGVDTSALRVTPKDDRSLDACFAIFAAIHKTVTHLAAVRRITWEVLDDFAADGVKYLELRTTPRDLQDADAEGYVHALLGILSEYDAQHKADAWPMTVRLLLSIDRTGSAARAMATVRLAIRLRQDLDGQRIVGVDFSGNPTRGSFADFAPAFEAARAAGLRIAVHTGEVEHAADNAAVLAFRPDRLGHALLLSPADVAALRAAPIPVELCPTSNKMTLRLPSLAQHPTMAMWHAHGYPTSISTDDSTVFNTCPSRELALAAETCGLSADEVVALARAPLDHAFDPDEAHMRELRARFDKAAAEALASEEV